jgi:hypothetical protein
VLCSLPSEPIYQTGGGKRYFSDAYIRIPLTRGTGRVSERHLLCTRPACGARSRWCGGWSGGQRRRGPHGTPRACATGRLRQSGRLTPRAGRTNSLHLTRGQHVLGERQFYVHVFARDGARVREKKGVNFVRGNMRNVALTRNAAWKSETGTNASARVRQSRVLTGPDGKVS